MHRREFLCGTGLALAAIATSARSQPELKAFRVAFVEAGSASANHHFLDAFVDGLRNLGYVPGKNVIIDVRWAEGRVERFPALIAEVIDRALIERHAGVNEDRHVRVSHRQQVHHGDPAVAAQVQVQHDDIRLDPGSLPHGGCGIFGGENFIAAFSEIKRPHITPVRFVIDE